MLEKYYNRNVSLQCDTCGSTCSFVTDEKTGVVTCKRCNRIYHGGYDELVNLNQKRIADEVDDVKKDVEKDIQKELNKIFEKFK